MIRPPLARAALVILFLLLSALHVARSWHTNQSEPTDFRTYYMASEDAVAGRNPYGVSDAHLAYIYPPLLLWLMGPLTKLPFLAGVLVWTLINLLAWPVVVALTLRLVLYPRRATWPLILLPSLACYRWILQNSTRGQLNLMVLIAVLAGLWCMQRGRERFSGLLFALAIHLKILPVVFLPYFAIRRRWTLLLAVIVAGVVLLFLPSLSYGIDGLQQMLGLWMARFGQHGADVALDTESGNQAPMAMFYRFLACRTVAPFEWYPPQVATWSPGTIWTLYLAFSVFVYASTLWVCRRPHSHLSDCLDIGLLLMAMHLTSKKTFEHHLVTLIFVYTVFMVALEDWRGSGTRKTVALTTLVSSVALQNFFSPMFIGSYASQRVGIYSPTTLALLLLWFGLLVLRLDQRMFGSFSSPTACNEPSRGAS